jgi:hypothetical protein
LIVGAARAAEGTVSRRPEQAGVGELLCIGPGLDMGPDDPADAAIEELRSGIRAIGVGPVRSAARQAFSMAGMSSMPCSQSRKTKSSPAGSSISMISGDGNVTRTP